MEIRAKNPLLDVSPAQTGTLREAGSRARKAQQPADVLAPQAGTADAPAGAAGPPVPPARRPVARQAAAALTRLVPGLKAQAAGAERLRAAVHAAVQLSLSPATHDEAMRAWRALAGVHSGKELSAAVDAAPHGLHPLDALLSKHPAALAPLAPALQEGDYQSGSIRVAHWSSNDTYAGIDSHWVVRPRSGGASYEGVALHVPAGRGNSSPSVLAEGIFRAHNGAFEQPPYMTQGRLSEGVVVVVIDASSPTEFASGVVTDGASETVYRGHFCGAGVDR